MKVLDDKTKKKMRITAMKLGQLWVNILAVELLLRQCIAKKYGREKEIVKLGGCKEGEEFLKSALFNCDDLYNVIEKFNCEFKDQGIQIDRDGIVRLRNAFAHRKLVSPDPYPFKVHNFSKIEGDDNHVKVEFVEEMTDEFMDKNIIYVDSVGKKISDFYDKMKKIS